MSVHQPEGNARRLPPLVGLLGGLLAFGLLPILFCGSAAASTTVPRHPPASIPLASTFGLAADPLALVPLQQAELADPNATNGDEFGYAVAISGDTALVGAPGVTVDGPDSEVWSGAGAVYVFTRSDGVWTKQAELTASDAASGDAFGSAVAFDGATAVIGAPGNTEGDGFSSAGGAYVFTGSGTSWTQQTEFSASDPYSNARFGAAVAVSGDTILAGAPGNTNPYDDSGQGSAYLFTGSGGDWTQQPELTDPALTGTSDQFGYAVALESGTALVGAPGVNSAGTAYLYTGSGASWTQQPELSASDAAGGDAFGTSVALSGDTALIGSEGADYVFTSSDSGWSQQAELFNPVDGSSDGWFGYTVALDGGTALVGEAVTDSYPSGGAWVFTGSGADWTAQPELSASDAPSGGGDFGFAVAISGDTALIGSPSGGQDEGGRVYVDLIASAPANTTAPGLSGTPVVGDTLTCSTGTWSGDPAPTLTYQWLRDASRISDATSASYTVQAADQAHTLSCQVTATNSAGQAQATSSSLTVSLAPANTTAPALSGAAAVGHTLTCSPGSWSGDPAPTLTYQWLRDASPINDATSASYTVQAADQAHTLSCQVTATNSAGQAQATSNSLTAGGATCQHGRRPLLRCGRRG